MNHRLPHLCAAGALVLWAAGCATPPAPSAPPAPSDPVTDGPELLEPTVPVGYQKIAPLPADDGRQMLAQTAAVFRGSLRSVHYTYEPCAGPRTSYVFSDAVSLLGSTVPASVTLRVLGGPTPSGRWVHVAELPTLALDASYVVFLRNTDWTYSPIVSNLALRIETVAGRELLVAPDGHAVTGFDASGPVLTAAPVSDAVGRQQRGLKARDAASTEARPLPAPTAATDAGGRLLPIDAAARPPQVPGVAPDAVPGAALVRAPALQDIRRQGLFDRPALALGAVANEPTTTVESFIAASRAAARLAQVDIGGRVVLDPNWRCWNSTPTSRVQPRQ